MDPGKLEYYEFLDFSDIEENERRQLKQALFSDSTPDFLQLPWTQTLAATYWQNEPYPDEMHHMANGPLDSVGETRVPQHFPAVTIYSQPPPPPVAYTVPPPTSGYQHPPNVFVSNVTANVNVHGYVPGHYVQQQPPQPYNMAAEQDGRGHRGRSRGRGNKRGEVRMDMEPSSPGSGFNPQYVPYYHPAYYTPQMQHPNAQQATGSPLYIAPVYPPLYNPYLSGAYYPAPPGPTPTHETPELMYEQRLPEDVDYQTQPEIESYVEPAPILDSVKIGLSVPNENLVEPNTNTVTVTELLPAHVPAIAPSPISPHASVHLRISEHASIPTPKVSNPSASASTVAHASASVPSVAHVSASVPPVAHKPASKPPVAHASASLPPVAHASASLPPVAHASAPVPLVTHASAPPVTHASASVPPVAHASAPAPIVAHASAPAPIVAHASASAPTVTLASTPAPSVAHVSASAPTVTLASTPALSVAPASLSPPLLTTDIVIINNTSEVKAATAPEEPTLTPVSTATTNTTMPPGKSWASLFNKSNALPTVPTASNVVSDDSSKSTTKPLALVSPFSKAHIAEKETTEKTEAKSVQSKLSVHSNDPNSYRMGEFLTKYALDNRIVSLQPRGLANRSNYCYINSILQALLACPPFYNLLKALPHQARKNTNNKSPTPIIDSMVEFINEFVPLSPESRLNRKEKSQRKDNVDVVCGTSFEPSRIYKILNGIRTDTFIVEGRQEDAEEFFGCLLNGLNDEMLELIKLVEQGQNHQTLSNGDITTNGEAHEQDEVEWKVMGPKNKGSVTRRADFGRTPISDIFRGQLRSRVHRAGDQITDNVQPFFTLQLDIEKTSSVCEALEMLVNKDKLEGVTCSRTNQQVEAWQQVTIEELPLVLVLHLKCFNYKLDACSKIMKALEFPIDLKIDAKLLSSKIKYIGKQKQYKLFAVVYHDGKEASKGHYLTDAYHAGYGSWVRYDDAAVKSVQETIVLHPNGSRVPYLLFYRRCDTIGSQQQQQNSKNVP